MKNQKITFTMVLVGLALLSAAAVPKAFGVFPPPDGGYPGFNTAEGQNALFTLTTGAANTAVGWFSLHSNTDGSFNTGVGAGTLLFNIGNQSTHEGIGNTAIGTAALLFNTTGSQNTAVGAAALLKTTGVYNTANGFNALFNNTTGTGNNAFGAQALSQNTTGSDNIALGFNAGNTVTTASDVICIGSLGGNVSNSIWIGNIYGTTTQSGTTLPVIVSDGGQLGTMSSSRRFKHEIRPMHEASEAILALKPVTFRYRSDRSGTPQFGLIAEDVAEVNSDLVIRDKEGKPYSVRYDQVNAMLLNEFLKEHNKVEEQQASIAQLKSAVAKQEAAITRQQKGMESVIAHLKEQDSKIERVSHQIQLIDPALKVAATDR
jgi:trimeric autotransporter adhesin